MPLAVHLASEEIMSVVYKQRTLSFATKFACEVWDLIVDFLKYLYLLMQWVLVEFLR